MTLINASLLAGVLLAGLPVVLHLMMRARPKRIEFPALRLLQKRHVANSRRMRIRHLLLLILRALVILVAVLALVRPSLPAARYGLRWYEWLILMAVTAAVVVVYRWLSARLAKREPAQYLLQEKRARLRAASVIAGLAAIAAAVGIPWGLRVQAELSAERSPVTPDIPVAAVFVFDTSVSMTYKQEGLTRLENAEQTAMTHLTVLPDQSRVAVMTTDPESEVVFQADLAGARSRIEELKIHAVPRPLNAVLKDAIEAHVRDREQVRLDAGGTDAFIREVYLLTDLAESAWQLPDESSVHDLLLQHDWLQLYLVDVGVENPNNIAVTQLRLDRESVGAEQPVSLSVTISGTAASRKDVIAELVTLDSGGNELPGGGVIGSPQRTVQLTGTPPVVTFHVRAASGQSFTQGLIRLSTPDPLSADDVRYFTFAVSPVPKVLLVGDRPLDTWILQNVLQPELSGDTAAQRFHCRSITGAEFSRENLKNYDVVCVLNWTRPSETAWSDLKQFVSDGGALLVSAGGELSLQTSNWSTTAAEQLLPGLPLLPVPFSGEAARLKQVATDHPIANSFLKDEAALTELNRAIFDRCWTFSLHPDARTILEFQHRNPHPALLERSVGHGRVLLFTSALDNNGTRTWNEDFVVGDNWAFLMLVDQMMDYLTGASSARHNFTVGEPVNVDVPAEKRFNQYLLARPRLRQTKGRLPFDESSVLITDAFDPGQYELSAADEGNLFSFSFSDNLRDQESILTPITGEQLDEVLGKDRYLRVTNPQELDRAVNLGRLGIEVFPVLMGLLIVLFCAEHLMANYFYDADPASA
ncbi:MAG: BatA domain-containing protein [Planctomycetaceae bacterium]